MNKMSQFFLSAISVISLSSLLADDSLSERLNTLENSVKEITFSTKDGVKGTKTAAAGPKCHYGWFFSVDTLYWQTKVDGLTYAGVEQLFQNTPVTSNTKAIEPSFHWNFGVKADVGYNFNYDGWDILADYTYFKNKGSSNISTVPPAGIFIFDANILSTTAASEYLKTLGGVASFAANASSHVKISLNDIHLELGRNFYVSKRLSLRPNFGLQGTWISIRQEERFFGGGTILSLKGLDAIAKDSTLNYLKTSKLVGMGPRVGVNTSWNLTHGFSFYGDFYESLLFAYIKKQVTATYTFYPNNIDAATYNFHRLVPVTAFELGLAYDHYLFDRTQHICVRLGYENQYFFNSIAMHLGRIPTSVGFYGVNLKIRWDF